MRIKHLLLLVFLFLGTLGFAQSKNYHIHEVEAGETLYSIARKYEVKVREIKKLNPDLTNDLPIGHRIVIPRRGKKEKVEEVRGYFEYQVKPKETLYSLAKRFNTNIPDLMDLNPELKEGGLKIGMMLKVPLMEGNSPGHGEEEKPGEILNQEILPSLDTLVESKSFAIRDTVKIALLLPLMAAEHDSLRKARPLETFINPNSKIGLSYYMGLRLALDSLAKLGLHSKVYVFDTEGDSSKVKEILRKPIWDEIDLAIGPLYGHLIGLIAPNLAYRKIPLINPFSRNEELARTHRNIWQCTPGYYQEAQYLGRYLGFNYDPDRLVLVHQNSGGDLEYVQAFKKNLIDQTRDTLDIKSWTFDKDVVGRLSYSNMPHDTGMVFVLISTNPAFVTDFLSNLSTLDSKRPLVFTFSNIEKMRTLEPRLLNVLRVHFTKPALEQPKAFAKLDELAIQAYNTPADRFMALAFDQVLFFGEVIKESKSIQPALHQKPQIHTYSGFYFLDHPGIGKVNQLLFLVRFHNFEIKRVK